MKKQLLYFMFAAVALCAACGDDDENYQQEVLKNPVTGITIENEFIKDGVMTIEGLGTTTTLQINVIPESATDAQGYSFRFSTSDKEIFTVDQDGIITGVAPGEAELTVTVVNDANIAQLGAKCKVVVVYVAKVEKIEITGGSEKEMKIGDTFDLNANITVLPDDVVDKSVSYTLKEGEGVVSLENGMVKALTHGKAVIVITANDMKSDVSTELTINITNWFDRANWTVDTSIVYDNSEKTNYVPDGKTGKPEDILDGDGTTFLSFVKPGKNYADCATPEDHLLFFVVDMKESKRFNYIEWTNRLGNAGVTGVHLRYVRLLGSNDNKSYTVIKEKLVLDHTNITTPQKLAVPESNYQYVKVEYTSGGWVSDPNSALQVGEFRVGIH